MFKAWTHQYMLGGIDTQLHVDLSILNNYNDEKG